MITFKNTDWNSIRKWSVAVRISAAWSILYLVFVPFFICTPLLFNLLKDRCDIKVCWSQKTFLGCVGITCLWERETAYRRRLSLIWIVSSATNIYYWTLGIFNAINFLVKPCKLDPKARVLFVFRARFSSSDKSIHSLVHSWVENGGKNSGLYMHWKLKQVRYITQTSWQRYTAPRLEQIVPP